MLPTNPSIGAKIVDCRLFTAHENGGHTGFDRKQGLSCSPQCFRALVVQARSPQWMRLSLMDRRAIMKKKAWGVWKGDLNDVGATIFAGAGSLEDASCPCSRQPDA
jgi:hypothetical protein